MIVALCALAGAALLCSLPAMATDDPYVNDVTLSAQDTSKSSSWNAIGFWSDGCAPDPAKTYSVTPEGLLFLIASNATFPNSTWGGGRLAISGIFRASISTGDKYSPYIGSLVLREGSEVQVRCYGPFYSNVTENVATSVRVEGTADSPARITHHYNDSFTSSGGARSHFLTADFTGTADSVLEYERVFKNYSGQACDRGFYCRIDSQAFANYPGTFRVTGGNTIVAENGTGFNWPQTAFCVADGAFCRFNRNDGTSYYADGVALRSLSVEDATVSFGYNTTRAKAWPLVTVSEGFSIDADSTVRLAGVNVGLLAVGVSADNPKGATPLKLLHLSGDAASNAPADGLYPAARFTIGDAGELPDSTFRLTAIDDGAGGKDVFVAAPNLVTMTNANVETTTATATRYGAFEAGHAGDWSNGETPAADSDKHYWSKQKLCFFESVNLPSATLTFGDASPSWKGGALIAFKEINMLDGVSLGLWASDTYRRLAAGRLNLVSPTGAGGTVKIGPSGGKQLTIDAELCSKTTDLVLHSWGVTQETAPRVDLNRVSTNFHARLTFTTDDTTGAKCLLTTQLGDARTWGGAYTATDDGYDAITLAKFVKVSVTNDVTFSEPTRGLLVSGGACFDVPSGRTLRFENPVTWAGEIEKTGEGVLDLAGTARFIDGAADTAPLAATNVLTIAEGALRVSSATAADGLAVLFAEGTRLIVPSDGEKGYCNVKWDAPLTIGAASGVLPVEIAVAKTHEAEETLEVPIATFSATAAASIPASAFGVAKTASRHRCKAVVKRENADGSVTYVAQMSRHLGLVFVIR